MHVAAAPLVLVLDEVRHRPALVQVGIDDPDLLTLTRRDGSQLDQHYLVSTCSAKLISWPAFRRTYAFFQLLRRPTRCPKRFSFPCTFIGEKRNQYVFRVVPNATKPEIKAAVEYMFKTQVKSVSVVNVRGKEKRNGRFMGRRNNWKKAYVALAEGQEINFAEGENK